MGPTTGALNAAKESKDTKINDEWIDPKKCDNKSRRSWKKNTLRFLLLIPIFVYFSLHIQHQFVMNLLICGVVICVFKCAENYGYFARRRYVANILTDEVKEDQVINELRRRKKREQKDLKKHLKDIEKYEKVIDGKQAIAQKSNRIKLNEKINTKKRFTNWRQLLH
ncbi:hypothetical protein RFI_31847 [Reticulomyxa filosa]|uniref:Uncharacterized protein n=1 Tax=Reticulomyxa filosa TaxID=46433 RepID=X6LVA8_RETFI|nr:hypothetical protein RFI_31847 [Reticulomyxa filosa]|eukprot:ETO05549.1 hypothetical protein RFI_31847 [Reticulomyxa filosa]